MDIIYTLFHCSVHLFLIILIYIIFKLNTLGLFLVFLAAILIDADHIPWIKKHGLSNWIESATKIHAPRKYPLHNFLTLFISTTLSCVSLLFEAIVLSACFLSVALHLFWDFFEDAFIFKIGINHWKV